MKKNNATIYNVAEKKNMVLEILPATENKEIIFPTINSIIDTFKKELSKNFKKLTFLKIIPYNKIKTNAISKKAGLLLTKERVTNIKNTKIS